MLPVGRQAEVRLTVLGQSEMLVTLAGQWLA